MLPVPTPTKAILRMLLSPCDLVYVLLLRYNIVAPLYGVKSRKQLILTAPLKNGLHNRPLTSKRNSPRPISRPATSNPLDRKYGAGPLFGANLTKNVPCKWTTNAKRRPVRGLVRVGTHKRIRNVLRAKWQPDRGYEGYSQRGSWRFKVPNLRSNGFLTYSTSRGYVPGHSYMLRT